MGEIKPVVRVQHGSPVQTKMGTGKKVCLFNALSQSRGFAESIWRRLLGAQPQFNELILILHISNLRYRIADVHPQNNVTHDSWQKPDKPPYADCGRQPQRNQG